MKFGPRRDRKRHPRSQVRRGPQPPPIGAFPRQRRLAGRTKPAPYAIRGHRAQLGPLDRAHRAGRAAGHHQDPATTLLLPGRTHPLAKPAASPCISPRAGPGETNSTAPGPIARSATPFLTTPRRSTFPPDYPTVWPSSAQAGLLTVSAGGLASKIAPSLLPQAVKTPLA